MIEINYFKAHGGGKHNSRENPRTLGEKSQGLEALVSYVRYTSGVNKKTVINTTHLTPTPLVSLYYVWGNPYSTYGQNSAF